MEKLDSKSIMIGDWLYLPEEYWGVEPTNIKVAEIYNDTIFTEQGLNEGVELPIYKLEPIPLTPEIFEKNGFTSKDDKLYKSFLLCVPTGHEKDSFTIQITLYKKPLCGVTTLFKCWGWIPPLQGGVNDLHICNLVSVHELQHALKLCGIDKEIKL